MGAAEREIVYETDEPSIRVRYCRSQAPPPYTYAVTVEVEETADNPRHDEMATRALLEGDAVVLVYDDRSELVIHPEPSGGARLETRHPSDQSIAA